MRPELEAWTSGVIGVELDSPGLPSVKLSMAVELFRVATLVQVLARAETEDPAFRELFPVVFATVEAYPMGSLARAPLAELGARVRQMFFDQLAVMIHGQLEAKRAAEIAMAEQLMQVAAAAVRAGGHAVGGSDPPGGVPSEGA